MSSFREILRRRRRGRRRGNVYIACKVLCSNFNINLLPHHIFSLYLFFAISFEKVSLFILSSVESPTLKLMRGRKWKEKHGENSIQFWKGGIFFLLLPFTIYLTLNLCGCTVRCTFSWKRLIVSCTFWLWQKMQSSVI